MIEKKKGLEEAGFAAATVQKMVMKHPEILGQSLEHLKEKTR